MDRAKFLRNLTLFTGILAGSPGIVLSKGKNSISGKNRYSSRISRNKRIWEGFKPDIVKTPWGQKVFYDRYTYIDLQNYKWRIEGHSWEEIRKMAKKIEEKIDKGILSFRQSPTQMVKGLWLIDIDGQQGIYLLESAEGLILIDPGMDMYSEKIIEQIKMLGFKKSDVRFVLLTHCHVDHAQSAAYWQKNGVKILIHSDDRNAVATGNEITAWWTVHDDTNRYFPPVKEDLVPFEDGDILTFGEENLYVCHTPGHTPGSSCFYLRKEDKNILISGDTIFHNGKHGWMGHLYVDYEAYIKSLWKLKNFAVKGYVHNEEGRLMVRDPIQYDMLLPGHTAISMDMVDRDIEKGIEIMSYTIHERRKGVDYQWTEPYSFFAEREVTKALPIQIEYR